MAGRFSRRRGSLEPEEVKANPADWRRIGEEHTERLDYQPARNLLANRVEGWTTEVRLLPQMLGAR